MNSNAQLPINFLLALALLTAACGNTTSLNPEGENSSNTKADTSIDSTDDDLAYLLEPNPASITITHLEDTVATAEIGSEGGVLETMDAKGTLYTLTIPQGALLSPEQISITPIASADGEVIGDTFLAGASLKPDNLHFFELVTLEISGGLIEAGAVAFAAEGGGQDVHLTPSAQTQDSIIITTAHFSGFGTATPGIIELMQGVVPTAIDARFDGALALGRTDEGNIRILQFLYINVLNTASTVDSNENWENWTGVILTLFKRTFEVARSEEWNEDTPGYSDLLVLMKNIANQWINVSDRRFESLAEHCLDGDIEQAFKIQLFIEVYDLFEKILEFDPRDEREEWFNAKENCTNWGLLWQGNVVASGSNVKSDISLIAEHPGLTYDLLIPFVPRRTNLEIEYVLGIFENCAVKNGETEFDIHIDYLVPNLRPRLDLGIDFITIFLTMVKPVSIDCSLTLGESPVVDEALALFLGVDIFTNYQLAFHGRPLGEINKDRTNQGRWEFKLDYDPGGGDIAWFEEGPKEIEIPTGKTNVWQLLKLYVR
ncbi:MAG: hypothetical protein N2D54_05865 [Chloroflexota bacterium]